MLLVRTEGAATSGDLECACKYRSWRLPEEVALRVRIRLVSESTVPCGPWTPGFTVDHLKVAWVVQERDT